MRRGLLDPSLEARIVSERALVYTTPRILDRPAHVRAASALAIEGGTTFVLQDDALYLGAIQGERVDGIAMPRVAGARRFEEALENRLAKPDFESCIALDGELFAFGSGSSERREWIYERRAGVQDVTHAPAFFGALRGALGALNVEGAAIVGDELWLCHRGNTSAEDGPAIAKVPLSDVGRALSNLPPTSITVERCDLGQVAGVRLGFTDATSHGRHTLIACAAEASPDAIADGAVVGSRIGVLDGELIRCAEVVGLDGAPIKLEGLALDPERPRIAWITIDPDDPEQPARLCEVELVGAWGIGG